MLLLSNGLLAHKIKIIVAANMFVNREHNSDGNIDAIPVLVYHNIDHESSDYATSIELFESEMNYLKQNGFKVIGPSDLI
jgi:hypothetical protein